MSVGPTSPIAAGFAGTPLAQTRGSESDRVQHEVGGQQLRTFSAEKAEAAAGIGETDGEDHQTAERDADGRRPWQFRQTAPKNTDESRSAPKAKDISGESGSLLDLSG